MAEIARLIKRYGITGLIRKYREVSQDKQVYDWTDYAPGVEEIEKQRATVFPYMPKISIVVPCYNTEENFLLELIRSVKMQSYTNWELILVDASDKPMVKLDELHNANIIVKHLPSNLGIAGNTNAGIALATGDYIGLLDHDDMLSANAVYEMVNAINHCFANDWDRLLLYSDEDKITEDGSSHFYPHFKIDYNKELFRHYNYICHFAVFSKELSAAVGNMNAERNGSQDYDLFLRLIEANAKVVHVPKILYHWRVSGTSTSAKGSSKMYAYISGVQAIEENLHAQGILGMVSVSEDLGIYNVIYDEYTGMAEDIDELSPYEITGAQSSMLCRVSPQVREVNIHPYGYNESANTGCLKNRYKNWRSFLGAYLNEDDVAIACSRSVKEGKVVCSGYREEDLNHISLYEGLPVRYKGYMKRAALPQDVDAFPADCVLAAKGEVLKKVGGMDLTLPSPQRELELSRRIREAGYRIVMVPQVDAVLK